MDKSTAILILILILLILMSIAFVNVINQGMVYIKQYGIKEIIIDIWQGQKNEDKLSIIKKAQNPCVSEGLLINY